MINFDIKNRFTGNVQFTAQIVCPKDAPRSIKLGLSVKWALKNGASLYGASLDRASLDRANLNLANLDGASLYGASLDRANLDGASLDRANLNLANLDGASLDRANLNRANLYGASLDRANLDRANLYGASLYGASLDGASLDGANLDRANLNRANGVNDYIKCIQIDVYPIAYTDTIMQIGCERHNLDEWRDFDDERIIRMDGKKALKFWRKHKEWIFQTIELCPAKPTGAGVAP